MSWVTPIYDRTSTDVAQRTAKAFLNISDWTRINGNINVIKTMLDANGYLDIPLNSLSTPTITTIPAALDINKLIENIERLRISATLPMALGLVVLFYAYIGGVNETAPDFENVNDWEHNLNIMYISIPKAIDYRVYCGVATSGQVRLWQNRFR